MADEEYVDPEFPEMEYPPEEFYEPEGNPEPEALDGGEEFSGEIPIPDELREQADLELIEFSPDASESFPVPESPLRGTPTVLSPDSGGALFLPEDDPIQQPSIAAPLDPYPVYTRAVPRRLRHLTCEQKGSEYHKPAGLYRPGN
jgi:hypothetical protein